MHTSIAEVLFHVATFIFLIAIVTIYFVLISGQLKDIESIMQQNQIETMAILKGK